MSIDRETAEENEISINSEEKSNPEENEESNKVAELQKQQIESAKNMHDLIEVLKVQLMQQSIQHKNLELMMESMVKNSNERYQVMNQFHNINILDDAIRIATDYENMNRNRNRTEGRKEKPKPEQKTPLTCFSCGQLNHKSTDCPNRKKERKVTSSHFQLKKQKRDRRNKQRKKKSNIGTSEDNQEKLAENGAQIPKEEICAQRSLI